jgi:hypothetical protein
MRQELGFSGELEDVVRTSLANQDEAGRSALSEYVTLIEANLGVVAEGPGDSACPA